jgi:hypothetical protein
MIDVRSPIASRDPGGPTLGHLNALFCRMGRAPADVRKSAPTDLATDRLIQTLDLEVAMTADSRRLLTSVGRF